MRPGEISLASGGVLFLDELGEFQPVALDALRQPLEEGVVRVSRARSAVEYPARFLLVAAMNPCRCGRAGDPGYLCKRGPNTRCAADYQARLSGPLIDRIDLHIEVPAVTAADLILPPPTEGSREVAQRVARAREIQVRRYAAIGLPHVRTNAAAQGPALEGVARPDAGGLALLREAADAMRLSARGYSSTEFVMRMSREEIGSYLGLKLETVSRLFSRFAEAGLIHIRQRHVKLVDLAGIKQLYSRSC